MPGKRQASAAPAGADARVAQVRHERDEDASLYFPSEHVLRQIIIIVRLVSAMTNIIHDCDETFNYWDPTHYLLHGYGLQVRPSAYDICANLLSRRGSTRPSMVFDLTRTSACMRWWARPLSSCSPAPQRYGNAYLFKHV